MPSNKPAIMAELSVVCLSWNHEKYIAQALNSVIDQTYKDLEIIYLDNASTDNSFKIGKDLLIKSGLHYKIHQFESNIGGVQAFNFALKNLVHSPYISIMSCDDWLHAENFEEKIKYSKAHIEYGIIYSYGYYYYEDKKKYSEISGEHLKEGNVFQDLLRRNFIFIMGCVIKKEVFDAIGLFNEENSIEDWDFFLRTARKFPIGLVRKAHFYYRQHSSNYTSSSHKYYQDCLAVINHYKEEPNHKIGARWISDAYIEFIQKEKFSWSNLKFILSNLSMRKQSIKNTIIFFIPESLKNSVKTLRKSRSKGVIFKQKN